MTASEHFLALSSLVAHAILSVAFLITIVRIIRGPGLPDRVLALDMLVAIAIGFIALVGIRTGFVIYLDIAIALALVGFLTTVAFARFIMSERYRREFRKYLSPEGDKDWHHD